MGNHPLLKEQDRKSIDYYSKFDPHETIGLFYDYETNLFYDSFGSIVFNIHRLLSPNQIFLFKHEIRGWNELVYTIPDRTNTFLIDILYYGEH